MFTYSLLVSGGFKVSRLQFDDVYILADPSWDGRDPEDVKFMETALKDSNLLVLSHSTPEYLGGFVLLCTKFKKPMENLPVYSTVAVSQLGRVSSVEFYRSNGLLGPVVNSLLEVSDIDEFFDRVISIKFSQNVSVLDNRVTLSAFNAGHSLGGSFWLIKKRNDKVIYAPAWNQSKDSFLQGAQFFSSTSGGFQSALSRPTALITGSKLGSSVPYRTRTERLLNLVDATLANGGAVLLPVNISGRFLEVFHLIDQHLSTLQGAAIPVYFISYSGTKVLSYTSSLSDWMASNATKKHEGFTGDDKPFADTSFDPSKVDQLLDPVELASFPGPKIVFASGLNMQGGDLSSRALSLLCMDEKTTIILTEKSSISSPTCLASQLYANWYDLVSSKQSVKSGDGVAVALEREIPASFFVEETALKGSELVSYQASVSKRRHERTLASMKDLRDRKILQSELQSDESDEEENDADKEEFDITPSYSAGQDNSSHSIMLNMEQGTSIKLEASSDRRSEKQHVEESELTALSGAKPPKENSISKGNLFSALNVDETFISDFVTQKMKLRKPVDYRLRAKYRPKQSMFPNVSTKRAKVDDYGEAIEGHKFRKEEEQNGDTKIISESRRRFEDAVGGPWVGQDRRADRTRYHAKDRVSLENKLTPQQILNNDILRKYLDTTFHPVKRGPSPRHSALTVRCGLAFVDFSGLVDARSVNLVISSLRPSHLVVLPDDSFQNRFGSDLDGASAIASFYHKTDQTANNSALECASSRRGKLANFLSQRQQSTPTEMSVTLAQHNSSIEVGGRGRYVDGEFDACVEESLWSSLKWNQVDSKHKVAQVSGVVEVLVKGPKGQSTTYSDHATSIVLRASSSSHDENKSVSTDKHHYRPLGVGSVRMPELKRKIQDLGFEVEFKGEGTLVVDDILAVRKTDAYDNSDNDMGDVIVDGPVGPSFYKVRKCIQEMLAFPK